MILRRKHFATALALSVVIGGSGQAAAQIAPADVEVTTPGPQGALTGSLVDPGGKGPLLVIIPGSGPTDRNGDNPLAVKGGPYRQLAQALAARGIASVRIDKRGMFGSRAAIPDPNHVTIADYAADARGWAEAMRQRTGRSCAWLVGHSEGGLVALQAAQEPHGICGVVLIAAPGRPLATVMREQLRANPANAPILDAALAALDAFQAGRTVDPATLPAPLPQLFPAAVQGFLIDTFRYDPGALAAKLTVPVLVLQGDRDVQVSVADAKALAGATKGARLAIVPGMTHVLRIASAPGPMGSFATYADASLPVAPAAADAIAGFVATPSSATHSAAVPGAARP